jgi:hypothetical protein
VVVVVVLVVVVWEVEEGNWKYFILGKGTQLT